MTRVFPAALAIAVLVVAGAAALVLYGVASPPILTGLVDGPGTPEAALAGDSGNPYRWCELGEALALRGETQRAMHCMRRAAELGGGVPPVLMRAANFWISEEKEREALDLMGRVLVQSDEFDGVIFGYYRRLEIPISEVLARGLPDDERTWLAYFDDVLGWAEPAAGELVWSNLQRRGWNTDETAGKMVGYLVDQHLYDRAVAVWAEQLEEWAGDYPVRNLVYNGGFERELTGTALDWWVRPTQGVRLERVPEGREGGWALRLEFDGTRNDILRNVAQRAFLEPGWYQWSACVRTEGVTTDKGIYVSVTAPGVDQRSEAMNGTNDWTELSGSFRARPNTTEVRLELRRDESLKIDNKLWGTVWVDWIRVEPQSR
jgi:hypothetical protein